ncbi:complex I NDUFA9 subunit family protein [Erythrobacteraceae bacterium WH01K]|nr:complex I NDUFA9 subunit family protein [Erythrobacteraceae bacterium WH01K]
MPSSSPLSGKLVTVFGGSGFFGTHVAQALLSRGARLRIAARHPEAAFSLKPLANLGQLQFARCNVLDERSVRACVQGADVVVNLVGSFEGNLMKLMGEAAGTIARAAADEGAGAMVQVSAIGADPDSPTQYAQAKALGEKLVSDAFPGATILRPSIIFGEGDNFLNMFAGLIRMMPALPIFGPESELQLVHVDDCAEAVAIAAENPAKFGGKTYELGGPEKLTMMEINERIAAAQRRRRSFIPMPDALSGAFAALPGTPMGTDQWTLLKQGSTVSGDLPGFKAFGIEPAPLGLYLDRWMTRYRKHGRFSEKLASAGKS